MPKFMTDYRYRQMLINPFMKEDTTKESSGQIDEIAEKTDKKPKNVSFKKGNLGEDFNVHISFL